MDHRCRSVLIVEDEVLIRLDLGAQLRAAGLTVLEAASADEASAILEEMDPVDLVVSDIRMPGDADGLDLLGWLRRERPGVKVILISGYIPIERLRSIAEVALTKPVDERRLVSEVRRLLTAAPASNH
jgi:DNA-binding NtrC family response regulator